MTQLTRQQRWAKAAFGAVSKAKKSRETAEHYRTLCMSTPFLIKQSGLVQAVAFLLRDKRNGIFVADLAVALDLSGGDALQKRAYEADLGSYLALTRDAIAVAVWFRRFAQAELGDTKSELSP